MNNQNISISDAQKQVDQWIKEIGVRYFSELTNLGQLMEEVGDEMADVLFVLICLANQSGIDLTEAFKKNMEKKTKRDIDRHWGNEKLTGER